MSGRSALMGINYRVLHKKSSWNIYQHNTCGRIFDIFFSSREYIRSKTPKANPEPFRHYTIL